nr:ribonuclease H-like domain-containing protein [Tanacetum cinerariifolium]
MISCKFGGVGGELGFIKGNVSGENNFVGLKVEATIAMMIGRKAQKYTRCGTRSQFVSGWEKVKEFVIVKLTTMVTRSQRGIVKPIKRLSLHTLSVSPIPKSLFLALKDPNWCNARYDEYNALVKNGTWILVSRPTDANLVQSMWLFKHKFHADGMLSRYKAQLVANGSSQQLEVDFDETFSPVVKPTTIRTTPVDTDSKLVSDVHHVCLYMHDLREPYFATLKCILRYVQGTLELCLHLYASATTSLVGYTDADWAGCPSTRRSTFGYCMFLGDNLLSWSAKRQHTISCSSIEVEYQGVANVVAETVWIHNLFHELHSPLLTATLVYCDNVSAVYMSANPVQHQHTKHIEIDIYFCKDLVLDRSSSL